MNIQQALQETGVAEASHDGYTITVREDEDENYNNVLHLSIAVGGMPPHYSQDFPTIEAAEKEITFPVLDDFSPVETEN